MRRKSEKERDKDVPKNKQTKLKIKSKKFHHQTFASHAPLSPQKANHEFFFIF
jgi:hypothetical protein